uniref:HEAT repeat-containing protein 1 n=1 Tax=Macrostomum lignano TaxID=282301 RepID=A0A1I8FKY8_9PLAT
PSQSTQLDGQINNYSVALICGRELVRLLGASEPKLVLNFCLGIAAPPVPACRPTAADIYRGFANSGSSSSSSSWESFGCALLVFADSGIEALPLVARLVPKLLPRLRPTVADQRPPGVVLLASFAFLQQCTVTMVDLMVPYLAQLLPVTVRLMLSAAEAAARRLRSVLSSVAPRRPSRPAAACTAGLPQAADQQQQPWLAPRATRARLLRLIPADERSPPRRPTGWRRTIRTVLTRPARLLTSRPSCHDLLLGNVSSAAGTTDADGDSASTDDDGARAARTESEEEGEGAAQEGSEAKGRLVSVASAAACLAPRCHLPPAAIAAAESESGRAVGVGAGLLCDVGRAQHAEPPCLSSPRRARQARLGPSGSLSAGLLGPAWCRPVQTAGGSSSGLASDLLDSDQARLAAGRPSGRRRRPAERLLDCLAAYAQGSSEDEALLKPLRLLLDCLATFVIDSLAATPTGVPALLPSSPRTTAKRVERLASGCWPTSSSGPASRSSFKLPAKPPNSLVSFANSDSALSGMKDQLRALRL